MKIIQPRKELRPYVRYYWMLESEEPFCILTFPIGCPQIIFHRKSPLYIPELKSFQKTFTISGQVNFPAHIRSDGNLDMIVAVFYPHTVGMFIGTPPSAFYNQEISGYDIANRQLNDIAARIFDSLSGGESVDILERWLLTRINPTLNIRRIDCSIGELMRTPSVSVNVLSDNACLSRKQYERVFRDQVGMNPKEYARVVRFQKAMWMQQCGSRDYAYIAHHCGYSDQSHLIRDFKAMSGHTPKSLLEHCAPYSDLFNSPV
ncbi:MAG: helix-turn-helix transcriptional regulator [Prevotella sp.]|nr:helix-turn-helix transcriptional regulator [Prevotella sp.]